MVLALGTTITNYNRHIQYQLIILKDQEVLSLKYVFFGTNCLP